MVKNFALIGAAGFVAPRHMEAIKQTGHKLVAALDKNDSVGIIDRHFPNAAFFTEFERFDRHIAKLQRCGDSIDYVSICSPNYLHDAHIRFGLRVGADVICEKPLVLNPWNVEALQEIEKEYDRHIYTILQLRLHPSVIELKRRVDQAPPDQVFDIDLTYQTSRGKWYYSSWKGDLEKSGGIATNIGVHFFDMLMWIFGDTEENEVHIHTHDRAAGFLKLKRARVKWFLSINYDTLSEEQRTQGLRTYRSLKIGDDEFEFSGGFTELHNKSYEDILSGGGFKLDATKKAIEVVHEIRNATPKGLTGRHHTLAELPVVPHPFSGGR